MIYVLSFFIALLGAIISFRLEAYFSDAGDYLVGNRKRIYFVILLCLIIFLGSCIVHEKSGRGTVEPLLFRWVLLYGLYFSAVIDRREHLIPNKLLLCMAGMRIVFLFYDCILNKEEIASILISAFSGFLFAEAVFLLARAICRSGIGMGDIKLVGILGFYLEISVFIGNMIITMILTAFTALFMLLTKKITTRSEIAFAPFIFAGTLITVLLGM